jgi:hypothetical protein
MSHATWKPARLCLDEFIRAEDEHREDLAERYAKVVLSHQDAGTRFDEASLDLARSWDRQVRWRVSLSPDGVASRSMDDGIRMEALKGRLILGQRTMWSGVTISAATTLLADGSSHDQDKAWALAARARANRSDHHAAAAIADCDELDRRFPSSHCVGQTELVRHDAQRMKAPGAAREENAVAATCPRSEAIHAASRSSQGGPSSELLTHRSGRRDCSARMKSAISLRVPMQKSLRRPNEHVLTQPVRSDSPDRPRADTEPPCRR